MSEKALLIALPLGRKLYLLHVGWMSCVGVSPIALPSFLVLLVHPCSFMLDPFSSFILILFPAPLQLVHGRPVARLRAPQDPVVAANSLGNCLHDHKKHKVSIV
jgi:hypothetical protein